MRIGKRSSLFALATLLFINGSAAFGDLTGGVIEEVKSAGTGGIQVSDICPADSVVVGIQGFEVMWQGQKVLSHVSAICRGLNADGLTLIEEISITEPRGAENTGSKFSMVCPKDQVLNGALVTNTLESTLESTLVSGIQIQCGTLPLGKDAKLQAIVGERTTSSNQLQCAREKIAIGLVLRFGTVLDAFGIQCGNVKNLPQKPLINLKLNESTKIYPYRQEIEVASAGGGSIESPITIRSVRNAERDIGCSYDGKEISSTAAGTCIVEIVKAGSSLYAPMNAELSFTFIRGNQNLELSLLNPVVSEPPFNTPNPIAVSGVQGVGEIVFAVSDGTAQGCLITNTDGAPTLSAETAGTCLVTASISEDDNFEATKIERSIALGLALPTDEQAVEPEGTPTESESEFPAYDPTSEPDKVVGLQVAAFALLSAISFGAAVRSSGGDSTNDSSRRRNEDEEREENSQSGESERESGDVASADLSKLAFYRRNFGWGDKSRIWQIGHASTLERNFVRWTENSARISPMLSRIFLDGSYLRAMFSAFNLALPIIAIFTSIFMLLESEFRPIPLSLTLLCIALFVGTLDAFAGFCAALVVLLGASFAGKVTSLDEFMSVIGFAAILITPGLIAAGVRPLRRLVQSKDDLWERLTDYLLVPLLGGWAIGKLVGALNGLAGLQLPITEQADRIGLIASFFILVRLILEDIATYLFPERLAQQEASPKDSISVQPWFSLVVKTSIFVLVSYQFLGLKIQLVLGALIFLVPQIFSVLSKNLHFNKYTLVAYLIPKGAPKIVIMVFVGGLFADVVSRAMNNPGLFIAWSFVLLALPGFLLGMLKFVSPSSSQEWKSGSIGTYVYRLGGIAIAMLIFAIYQGVDLYSLVMGSNE